jgi:stalled ribosome rescue protein Dom34
VDPVGAAALAFQRIVAAVEGRQKLIRMADRSELGWRVVQHYLADPIADNAEDEKRIKKATKSAEAELKALQDKKGEYGVFCYS